MWGSVSAPHLGVLSSTMETEHPLTHPQGRQRGPQAAQVRHTGASPLLCRGSTPCSSESGSLLEARSQDLQQELLFPEHTVFLEASSPPSSEPRPPPAHSHRVAHYCRFSLYFCVASGSLSPEDPPHIPTGRLDLALGCHILTPKTKGLKEGCGLLCDGRAELFWCP